MERTITEKLERWYAYGKGCLCLYGARGVGKTYAVRGFLSRVRPGYVEADVRDDRKARELLSGACTPKSLAYRLKRLRPDSGVPGNAVFLDGGAAYPGLVDAAAQMSVGGTRVVLTGERLPDMRPEPMRRTAANTDFLRMCPMSFQEFMRAAGTGADTVDRLRECAEKAETPEEELHAEASARLREYLLVGGMPMAVAAFLGCGDVSASMEPHDRVMRSLRECAAERDDGAGTARRVLDTAADGLDRDAKGFAYDPRPGESADRDTVFSAVRDLQESCTLIPSFIRHDAEPRPYSRTAYSGRILYMCDVGLLSNEYWARGYRNPGRGFRKAVEGDAPVVHGAVQENFVAEELTRASVPFFSLGVRGRGGQFVARREGGTYAVCVRAGKKPAIHTAGDAVCSRDGVDRVYVLDYVRDVETEGKRTTMPLYMAAFLPLVR